MYFIDLQLADYTFLLHVSNCPIFVYHESVADIISSERVSSQQAGSAHLHDEITVSTAPELQDSMAPLDDQGRVSEFSSL